MMTVFILVSLLKYYQKIQEICMQSLKKKKENLAKHFLLANVTIFPVTSLCRPHAAEPCWEFLAYYTRVIQGM